MRAFILFSLFSFVSAIVLVSQVGKLGHPLGLHFTITEGSVMWKS